MTVKNVSRIRITRRVVIGRTEKMKGYLWVMLGRLKNLHHCAVATSN